MVKGHRSRKMLFSIGLALTGLLSVALGVRPVARATDDAPVSPLTAPAPATITGASLHNPSFDNHLWYEFNDRYHTWYAGSWVPDDDTVNGPQNWRLWYMRGTPLIKSFAESSIVHSVAESVAMRSYDGNTLQGGLYQIIYNTTPCLQYRFDMYALTRPDAGVSQAATLKVGIDQAGWHTDPAVDPAVPGAFPDTTVWGTSQDYKYPNFGPLTVTAEALASTLTVFSYAEAQGGPLHAIVWDTGLFQDVTPGSIFDPETDALNPAGISSGPTASTTSTTAHISWQSSSAAISQVFYRLQSTSTTPPPTEPLTYTIYLPFIAAYKPWVATALIKTADSAHVVDLADLLPNSTYEYIVVSRGVSGEQCVTWSKQDIFSTQP